MNKMMNNNQKISNSIILTILIPGALHAMEKLNPHAIRVQCDIHKKTDPNDGLSFITFSRYFSSHIRATLNVKNAVALQCSITKSPTITINPSAKSMIIQCAFKDPVTQQSMNVREDIVWGPQPITRALSDDWQMTITTTLPHTIDR